MEKALCKSKAAIILLILTLLFCFVLAGQAHAVVRGENSKGTKQTIEKYFHNNYEVLKGSKSVNYEELIKDKDFKEFVDLKNKFNVSLRDKLNRDVSNIKYNIEYNSIDINNNECIVDLDVDIKTSYNEDGQDEVDSNNENHILLLKLINNKWYIAVDAYDPLTKLEKNIVKDNTYVKNEICALKESIKTIDNRVNVINSIKYTPMAAADPSIQNSDKVSAQRYNRSGAAEYARKYALSYNPRYPDFNGEGGDCTNFVSQCLANNNIPSSTPGEWFVRKDKYGNWDYGLNWVRVEGLNSYLTSYGFAKSYVYSMDSNTMANLSRAEVGDILQLKRYNYSRYTHSLIIDKIANGDMYYCCHSYNIRSGSFKNRVLEGYMYSTVRLVHITY